MKYLVENIYMVALIASKDPLPNSNYLLKLKNVLAFNAPNIQNICPFFRHSSKLTPPNATKE
jgi:hypothetical protein